MGAAVASGAVVAAALVGVKFESVAGALSDPIHAALTNSAEIAARAINKDRLEVINSFKPR